MIYPVVVVDITLKAVISCTVPERESTTCAVDSGFFIAPSTSTVPHTIASIYMDGVGENIGQRITPLNPRRLCAWYCIRQGDMVRQDPYRMKRILKGKLVHSVHGLGGDASHPWGNYCQKESNHEQTRSKSTLKPSQRRCTTPPLYHHQSPNHYRRHLC